jgi:hypothetical protein
VVGERLACPFHAWEYGTGGACERIPYSDHIPARGAAVRPWPTEERSGIIMVWHSPHGRAPHWEPPVLEEYDDPDWTDYVVRERRIVRTTAHEIAENIVDLPHIQFIHGGSDIPPADVTTDANVLSVVIRNDLPTVGAAQINTVRLHGLGIILNHGMGHAPKAGFSANTPIDREHVDVRFSITIRRHAPGIPTGEASLRSAQGTVKEFEKDIPIWENKIHRRVPTSCKDDGPIGRFRTWARQFY